MIGRLNDEEIDRLLAEAEIGCISMCGVDGKPYSVAVNFWGDRGGIYFHCGKRGKKLECIEANPYVCMFIYETKQYRKGSYSTKYESVLVRGRASIVTDKAETDRQLTLLCGKFGEGGDDVASYIRKYEKAVTVVKIEVVSVTGKFNR